MLSLLKNKQVRLGFQCSKYGRNATVRVLASRRQSHEKRNPKKELEPRQCPCGSGVQFRDCCAQIVGGAWARTAPELARARFSAVVLGDKNMLADTTHPESLDAIGTKKSLREKVLRFMRYKRGAAEQPPSLIDSVHGQSPDNTNEWYVLLAVAVGPPGAEDIHTVAELYRKDEGRWWFMGDVREFPNLDQFQRFLELHGEGDEDGEDNVSPFQGRYDYSWVAFPPRPLSAVEAQRRPQWLLDEWPQEGGGQGERVDWVYLDTAIDPQTGQTAAQHAAQTKHLLHAMMRDSKGSFYAHRGSVIE